MKLRHALFKLDPKYKKQKKYADDESDIDDDWIASHEEQLKAKEIEKAEKKFAKENEKLEEDGKTKQADSVLQERLDAIEEDFQKLEEERGTGKATLKRERAEEKIEEAIDKLTQKIKSFKLQIDDRDAGKEVALGTSKINYLDPRYDLFHIRLCTAVMTEPLPESLPPGVRFMMYLLRKCSRRR